MKTLLFILASTLAFGQTALINGSSAKFRNVTGTAAPSSGTCDASSEVGSFYVRTGNQASVPTQVYVCKQTGSSTYAWGPFFGYTQTAAPATCATGELWFDTDATAGSNLNLCTASNTWTAISSGGGSGTVSVVSSGSLTSTALVTGGGTTTLQTPASSATLDSSGNLVVNSISTGSSAPTCTAGTAGLLCLKEGTAGTGEASAALLYSKTDHLLYANLNNGGEVQVPTATSTATLTNKTFDTAGTGNSFKINGTAITAVSGSGAVCLATGSSCSGAAGAVVSKKCAAGSSLSGSAGPSTLGSYTFASGLAAGDMVRVTTFWTHSGGTTQTPRAQFNLGGTNVNVDAGSATSWATSSDVTAAMDFVIQVVSTSSQRVQGGYYRFGGITAPYSNISATSLGVTTSGSTALDIVGSFASGTAETLSLDHYCIELIPAA